MPDLRSLEERIAEMVREELDKEKARIAEDKAQEPHVPQPVVRKPSEPHPNQVPPGSLMWSMRSKDPTVFTLYSLAVFTLGICSVLVAIAAWSVACR